MDFNQWFMKEHGPRPAHDVDYSGQPAFQAFQAERVAQWDFLYRNSKKAWEAAVFNSSKSALGVPEEFTKCTLVGKAVEQSMQAVDRLHREVKILSCSSCVHLEHNQWGNEECKYRRAIHRIIGKWPTNETEEELYFTLKEEHASQTTTT